MNPHDQLVKSIYVSRNWGKWALRDVQFHLREASLVWNETLLDICSELQLSDSAVQILWKGKDGGGPSRSQALSDCRTTVEWDHFYESAVISPDRPDDNSSPTFWQSITKKSPKQSELQQQLQNEWGSWSSGPKRFCLESQPECLRLHKHFQPLKGSLFLFLPFISVWH